MVHLHDGFHVVRSFVVSRTKGIWDLLRISTSRDCLLILNKPDGDPLGLVTPSSRVFGGE